MGSEGAANNAEQDSALSEEGFVVLEERNCDMRSPSEAADTSEIDAADRLQHSNNSHSCDGSFSLGTQVQDAVADSQAAKLQADSSDSFRPPPRVAEHRSAEPSREGEGGRKSLGSLWVPRNLVFFPDDFQIAEINLSNSQVGGTGVQEALAKLKLAEIYFDSAKFGKAEEMAKSAWEIFSDSSEPEDEPGQKIVGEAKAVRILIKVKKAEEQHEEALKLAREQLEHLKSRGSEAIGSSGNSEAGAILSLAIAKVRLEQRRLKLARGEAETAYQAYKSLGNMEGKDEMSRQGMVRALLVVANAQTQFGDASNTKQALDSLTEALQLCQDADQVELKASVLCAIAKTHLARQEVQQAFDKAHGAAEFSRDEGDRKSEARALKLVAEVCLAAQTEHDVAKQMISSAIDAFQKVGDPLGEFGARHVAAQIYQLSENADESFKMLVEALALADGLQDRRQIRSAIEMVVSLLANLGRAENALAIAREEAELAESVGEPRRHLASLQTLAGLLLTMERLGEALEIADEAMKLLGSNSDKKVGAWCLQLQAEVRVPAQRYREAIKFANEALDILQAAGDVQETLGALQLILNMHVQMGDNEGALMAKAREPEIYRVAGWMDEALTASLGLAETHLSCNNVQEAMRVVKTAVAASKELGDKAAQANALLALARCQTAAHSATDALKTTDQAGALFNALDDAKGEATSLQAKAEIYVANKNLEEAVRFTQRATVLLRKAGDAQGELETISNIANLRLKLIERDPRGALEFRPKSINDALESVQEFLSLAQGRGDTAAEFSALLSLAFLHRANKDGESAKEAASTALQQGAAAENAQMVGTAMVEVAQAQLLLGERDNAASMATEAIGLLEQVGDQEKLQVAHQVVADAQKAEDEANEPSKLMALQAKINRITRGGSGGTPGADESEPEEKRSQQKADTETAVYNKVPDQEERRRQLIESMNEKTNPQVKASTVLE